jgi:hypothetical protein
MEPRSSSLSFSRTPSLAPTVALLAMTVALTLALPAPAPAQESRPTTTTTAEGTKTLSTPGLVVKTADDTVAMSMLSSFGSPDPLPELKQGEHYVLKLFGPDKLKISTGDGDVGFLQAVASPGPLVEVFEEAVSADLSAVEANVTITLGQLGFPTKETAKMIKAVAGFPNQIAQLDLRIKGNPMAGAKGVSVDLRLTPAADTWLSRIVAGLQANDQGAPVLDANDVTGAPMTMSVAVKPRGLETFLAPVLGFMSFLGTKNKDERQSSREMLLKILKSYDGSMAATGDPFAGNFRAITGLRDATGVKEVMATEAFAKFTENQASIVPTVDAEYEQKAFKHRDVTVSRLTMDMSAGGMDQVTTQYTAVAGGYLVSYSGDNEDAAKALIDAVLDQRVKRAPLTKNALLTLTLDLEKMFDRLAGFGLPAPMDEDGPKLAKLRLFRGESSLQLKVSIE